MPKLNEKLLGKHIKERRLEIGITQAELANRIGKSTSAVQKYENGLIEIPFNVLEKIGEVLNKNWMLLYPISIEELESEANEYNRMIEGPPEHPQFNRGITELLNQCCYSISYDEQKELLLVDHDGDSTYITQREYDFLVEKVISYFKYLLKEESTI